MNETGVPMAAARARLAELVDRTRRSREPVYLTRSGRPVAVLVAVEEWELAAAALEATEEAEVVAAYDEAVAASDGTRVSHDGVMAEPGPDAGRRCAELVAEDVRADAKAAAVALAEDEAARQNLWARLSSDETGAGRRASG